LTNPVTAVTLITETESTPMNVSLTPKLEKFVSTKVKSGRYNSASEVVREALRLLEDQERIRARRLAGFQTAIDERLASLDRGDGLDGHEFFKNLELQERRLETSPSKRKRA
jgi:antitoxin ParD1/3/4